MSAEVPEYSFFPWSRRGLAVDIEEVDHLGFTPGVGPKDRATLSATVSLDSIPVQGAPAIGTTAISKTVSLVGPGDIKSFAPDVVILTVPAPGTINATPGELAYVDFYDEDLPWRYSPARATADHKLRPWIVLLVLADDEYTLTPVPGEASILTVDESAPLPLVTETWAWAHVQGHGDLSAGDSGAALEQLVAKSPDLARSRLLSPRLLKLDTSYHAFVVPAFETGRLAGLRTPAKANTVPAQQPSWGDRNQPRVFPVLYDWSFRTSPELTDFEVLARRPKAFPIESEGFGTRELDISNPGAGLDVPSPKTVAFEGALAPINFERKPFPDSPGDQVAEQLRTVLDRSADLRKTGMATTDADEDPILTPPAYACKHVGLERIADVTSETQWLAELNLDPRNRVAAGLGAEIVRQRDEEYMERAWAQVEELDAVNQRLREADMAMLTSDRIFVKHMASIGTDRFLGLTSGTQSALRIVGIDASADLTNPDLTIRGKVDGSRVPAAVQTPAFRRITRPGRPLIKSLISTLKEGEGFQSGLLDRLNEDPGTAVSSAPPVPDHPTLSVALSFVNSAVTAMAAQLPRGRDAFPAIAGEIVEARRLAGTLSTITLEALHIAVRDGLDAEYPASVPENTALRAEAIALNDLLASDGLMVQPLSTLTVGSDNGDIPTVLRIPPEAFSQYYGDVIDGKNYLGLVIAPTTALTLDNLNLAATASLTNARDFNSALSVFSSMADSLPTPQPAEKLTSPLLLVEQIAHQVRPMESMPNKLSILLGGVGDLNTNLANSRRLQPVMEYPSFDDPLFESLRLLGQDYIVPNIANLPVESIALMEPNMRFIESLLAGVNTEFARELLWNEYPTDQRGTYFARFFDAADAGQKRPPDITKVHSWKEELGGNSAELSGLIVLVIRSELLIKFPDTIVFAQKGTYVGAGPDRPRTLDRTGEVRYPVIRGRLDPDIALYGFKMTDEEAAGTPSDAGFFFCFMERPGQLRFGLDIDDDLAAAASELKSWNDLNWKHLQPIGGQPAYQVLVDDNSGLTPTTTGLPRWGQTSAHMASILSQNPVWVARHTSDMLPLDS